MVEAEDAVHGNPPDASLLRGAHGSDVRVQLQLIRHKLRRLLRGITLCDPCFVVRCRAVGDLAGFVDLCIGEWFWSPDFLRFRVVGHWAGLLHSGAVVEIARRSGRDTGVRREDAVALDFIRQGAVVRHCGDLGEGVIIFHTEQGYRGPRWVEEAQLPGHRRRRAYREGRERRGSDIGTQRRGEVGGRIVGDDGGIPSDLATRAHGGKPDFIVTRHHGHVGGPIILIGTWGSRSPVLGTGIVVIHPGHTQGAVGQQIEESRGFVGDIDAVPEPNRGDAEGACKLGADGGKDRFHGGVPPDIFQQIRQHSTTGLLGLEDAIHPDPSLEARWRGDGEALILAIEDIDRPRRRDASGWWSAGGDDVARLAELRPDRGVLGDVCEGETAVRIRHGLAIHDQAVDLVTQRGVDGVSLAAAERHHFVSSGQDVPARGLLCGNDGLLGECGRHSGVRLDVCHGGGRDGADGVLAHLHIQHAEVGRRSDVHHGTDAFGNQGLARRSNGAARPGGGCQSDVIRPLLEDRADGAVLLDIGESETAVCVCDRLAINDEIDDLETCRRSDGVDSVAVQRH